MLCYSNGTDKNMTSIISDQLRGTFT